VFVVWFISSRSRSSANHRSSLEVCCQSSTKRRPALTKHRRLDLLLSLLLCPDSLVQPYTEFTRSTRLQKIHSRGLQVHRRHSHPFNSFLDPSYPSLSKRSPPSFPLFPLFPLSQFSLFVYVSLSLPFSLCLCLPLSLSMSLSVSLCL